MKSRRSISVICIILALLMLCSCSDTSSTNNNENFKTESGIPINTNSEYSLGGKKSITQMKGAKVVKDLNFEIIAHSKADEATPEKYTQKVKSFPTVIGEVVNMCCVTIKDGLFTWTITSFDIEVSEAITQSIEDDIITCVTVCQYRNGFSMFNSKNGLSDVAYEIIQNPNGFYVLTTQTRDYVIRGEKFDFSEYADYYVGVRFNYEEDGFIYNGVKIKFDDIRCS